MLRIFLPGGGVVDDDDDDDNFLVLAGDDICLVGDDICLVGDDICLVGDDDKDATCLGDVSAVNSSRFKMEGKELQRFISFNWCKHRATRPIFVEFAIGC